MPIYEITDTQSLFSPMHDYGFGDDAAPAATVPETSTDTVMKKETEEETDWMAYLSPIIAGTVMAVFAYGISRKFDVDKSKARGIAVTMGGITALGHGLSTWMFKKAEPIRKAMPQQTVAAATTGASAASTSDTAAG